MRGGDRLMANGICKKIADSVRGQSTLEYILVLAAIIAAVALAAGTLLSPAVNQTMTNATGAITNAAANLQTKLQ